MRTPKRTIPFFAIFFAAFAPSLFAQLAIPSDGSDGTLNIITNTTIDLSLAANGAWNANNSANAGKGIYDSSKWAVVFKYSSVTVASNAIVTFKNHASRAPVVWLVNGDVTINGELSLDGQNGINDPVNLAEPGPGGFRGGAARRVNQGRGVGFGPGGGEFSYDHTGHYNTGETHGYGNLQIVPLIGGSGGAAEDANGGGGGGAILIAASGAININAGGYLLANGGGSGSGYGGSGGAIRLIANQINGSGRLDASSYRPGRIRLEANSTSPTLVLNPTTTGVSPLPLTIWPPDDAPRVTILSIAGQVPPSEPRAIMSAANGADDLTIATNSSIAILLQTANFPTNGTVDVFFKPRNADGQYVYNASVVSGTSSLATWRLLATPPLNHFIVQVRAHNP